MRYKRVIVTRTGSPEVLQVVESELRPPARGEARIRVQAAAVCRPDITLRRGENLCRGTPLGYRAPFVLGYFAIGIVDVVGEDGTEVAIGDRAGALTVVGGYTEWTGVPYG